MGTTIPNVVNNLVILVYVCRILNLDFWTYVRKAWIAPGLASLALALGWLAVNGQAASQSWLQLVAIGATGASGFLVWAILAEVGVDPVVRGFRFLFVKQDSCPLILSEEVHNE